ncbi:MAG TPA: DUF4292 domain-containing protein [Cyclobacteriaceae bacterium]|nr:DUF4292 domain-containing protein [Cyclobacteriaceae bacterium]
MNRTLLLLSVFCIALITQSCSKKTIPLTEYEVESDELIIDEASFDYFSGKANMYFKDEGRRKDVKAQATIRMRKDSVIWINLKAGGGVIQGGKALINRDSICIVNDVDKEYYVFTYEDLSKEFNFDMNYDIIQSAALGNLIMLRKLDDDVDKLKGFFLLKQQSGTVTVSNYINDRTMKLERLIMKESESNNVLTITYGNFQVVGDKVFPYNGNIDLVYKTLGGLLNTSIQIEYSKAEMGDKELNFKFNIPKKYERK